MPRRRNVPKKLEFSTPFAYYFSKHFAKTALKFILDRLLEVGEKDEAFRFSSLNLKLKSFNKPLHVCFLLPLSI
jgi:hypothetical protein